MTRTLGAPDLVCMPLQGFLRALNFYSTSPLAGTAAWLGAGGEVGASERMVATTLSFVGGVLRRPRNAVGDKGAVVVLCAQRKTGWDLGGRARLQFRVLSFKRGRSVASALSFVGRVLRRPGMPSGKKD